MKFEWDKANLDHIANHQISATEVEQIFSDLSRLKAKAYSVGQEERFATLGQTKTGRILTVIYTIRNGKIRVITAYRATKKEQRRYQEGP
ncbi:MAG: BrnT family toxin [Halothece sp.]